MQPDSTGQARPRFAALLNSPILALLIFGLLSALFTWPLVTHLDSTLPDWADAADSTWRIGTIASQLRSDPLRLYDSPAFYPLRDDLALDELLTGQGLLGAPVVWLIGPVFAYNLLNFLSYVLSGFAMWLLVRHLTRAPVAGYAAGAAFAFSPWHVGQYGHLGLGAHFWMVFALLALMRFLEESAPGKIGRRALLYLALFAVLFTLQALVAGYYAYFEAILVAIYLLYYFFIEGGLLGAAWARIRSRRAQASTGRALPLLKQMGLLALAGALCLAALTPFVLPFVRAKEMVGFERGLQEVEYWSAGLKSLLRTTPHSPLYEPLQKGLLGLETSPEREMYPGAIVLALAFAGLLLKWQGPGTRARPLMFGLVALVGLILSFGPTLHIDAYGRESTGLPLPYAVLYRVVPGFDSLRVPARFGMLFMLGLAICAGYGVARLLDSRRRGAITLALAAPLLVAAEFSVWGLPYTATPMGDAAPPAYRLLASQPDRDAILLELPVGEAEDPVNTAPIYMVYGLQHGLPMLNGSSNIVPRGYDRLFYEMRRFPTPGTLDIAEALGVDYLLVHTAGLLNDEKRAALLAEIAEGGRLERVAEFPDYRGRAGGTDLILRVKKNAARRAGLAEAIPPGSSVLLTDQKAINRRLYTALLPYFIGPGRRYFATYSTIYDGLAGEAAHAEQGAPYDFAILYKGDDPARFGYASEQRVPLDDPELNELVELYRR